MFSSLFKQILNIVLFSFFISCDLHEETPVIDNKLEDVKIVKKPLEIDTLEKGNDKLEEVTYLTYQLKDTILPEYFKFDFDFIDFQINEINLNEFSNVDRIDDTLFFKTDDTTIVLINSYFNEEEQNYDAAQYKIIAYHKEANIYELFVNSYEYYCYMLVDMNYANEIYTIGRPLFSEDLKYIFVSNVDLETQYTENGFELYNLERNGYVLVERVILDLWGIGKASWQNEHKLVISKVTLDEHYDEMFSPAILSLFPAKEK